MTMDISTAKHSKTGKPPAMVRELDPCCEDGTTAIEYALIASVIAAAIVVGASAIGVQVSAMLNAVLPGLE